MATLKVVASVVRLWASLVTPGTGMVRLATLTAVKGASAVRSIWARTLRAARVPVAALLDTSIQAPV